MEIRDKILKLLNMKTFRKVYYLSIYTLIVIIFIILLLIRLLPIEQYVNIATRLNSKVELEGIETIEIPNMSLGWYKWVGVVHGEDDNIYAIPTGAKGILKINTKTGQYTIFGKVEGKNFKYTGGCLYKDGYIYGFPRRSNNLLKIDTKKQKVEEIPLDIYYDETKDHHYSGTLHKDIAYLAPREADHILAINLKDYSTKKIGTGQIPKDYEYCGAIMHYNGLIYFFPNNEVSRIMVLNPETEQIEFIGETNGYLYGSGAIANNGCIYGFTAYSNGGILKIDPKTNEVSRILQNEVESGFFGTKMGINGKMYSVPGISNRIYEFEPETENVRLVYTLEDDNNTDARCAGGMIDSEGNIWLTPAKGDKIYKLKFGKHVFNFRDDILQSVYFSNY